MREESERMGEGDLFAGEEEEVMGD